MNRRSLVKTLTVVLLLALSLLLGYLTDLMLDAVERTRYPRHFSDYVSASAESCQIPESLIYALIKCESNFSSNHITEDGCVGLIPLSRETFRSLSDDILQENLNDGLLYDPETNVRYGTYYLLTLLTRYGDWQLVLCAYLTDTETTDSWSREADLSQEDGNAWEIPDRHIRRQVEKIMKVQTKYQILYQNKGE